MQNNNRKKNNEMKQEIPVSQAATLEVIAGLFATLSEGLATFAAALAIQEVQQQANSNNSIDIQEIHQQLNYLTKEMKKISKALNI
jgi:hypothetical protein